MRPLRAHAATGIRREGVQGLRCGLPRQSPAHYRLTDRRGPALPALQHRRGRRHRREAHGDDLWGLHGLVHPDPQDRQGRDRLPRVREDAENQTETRDPRAQVPGLRIGVQRHLLIRWLPIVSANRIYQPIPTLRSQILRNQRQLGDGNP